MKVFAICLLISFASSQASPTSQVKGSQTKETAKTGSSSQEKVVFPSPLKASVKLVGSNPAVSGSLFLTQDVPESGPVRITGTVSGISEGSHGFHVHQLGDIVTNGCLSTGGHFNPLGHQHGAPADTVRHAGDLGNIVADASGVTVIDVLDNQISLSGVNSIVGRAFVVHEKVDDLGRGGDSGSLATGNAGSRVACGVVGLM